MSFYHFGQCVILGVSLFELSIQSKNSIIVSCFRHALSSMLNYFILLTFLGKMWSSILRLYFLQAATLIYPEKTNNTEL